MRIRIISWEIDKDSKAKTIYDIWELNVNRTKKGKFSHVIQMAFDNALDNLENGKISEITIEQVKE